jgi:hypothetical protein
LAALKQIVSVKVGKDFAVGICVFLVPWGLRFEGLIGTCVSAIRATCTVRLHATSPEADETRGNFCSERGAWCVRASAKNHVRTHPHK